MTEIQSEATLVNDSPRETSSSDSEVENTPLKKRKYRFSDSDSDIPLEKRAKEHRSSAGIRRHSQVFYRDDDDINLDHQDVNEDSVGDIKSMGSRKNEITSSIRKSEARALSSSSDSDSDAPVGPLVKVNSAINCANTKDNKERDDLTGSGNLLSLDNDEGLSPMQHKRMYTKTKQKQIKVENSYCQEENLPLSDVPFDRNDPSDSESDSASSCAIGDKETFEYTARESSSNGSTSDSEGETTVPSVKRSGENENLSHHGEKISEQTLGGSLLLKVQLTRCDGIKKQTKETSVERIREHKLKCSGLEHKDALQKSPVKLKAGKSLKRKKKSDVGSDESDVESTNSSRNGSKSSRKRLSYLQQLLRIQRASGIFLWYPTVFKDCTQEQKIKKIKKILLEAGMIGQPTMKKAEELKLKKEAAELDTDNIICMQGRSCRSRVTESEPLIEETDSINKTFSRLKDIVDTEDSSD